MGATSYAIVDKIVKEGFTVNRRKKLISGIPLSQFSYTLYNPSDTLNSVPVTLKELGDGNYRAEFTPDIVGDWYLVVYHPRYFPWGKANGIKVQPNDIETVRKVLTNKQTLVKDTDGHYVQTIYDDDETTPIQTNDLTCSGDTETRDPR